MRRSRRGSCGLCNRGGAIEAPSAAHDRYVEIDQAARNAQNNEPTLFYPRRLRFVADSSTNIVRFIKAFAHIPDHGSPANAQTYNNVEYDDIIEDFNDYGKTYLATNFGINDKAPLEFFRYLPTFIAYDFVYIRGMNSPGIQDQNQQLRIGNLIRTVLPVADPDNFSKWETFYREFKSGKYSGGMARWRARKAADTPYDPVDPIFDFTQEPRLKIPKLDTSAMATGDALYFLNRMPPTKAEINDGVANIFQGGASRRRAARSSRRRI